MGGAKYALGEPSRLSVSALRLKILLLLDSLRSCGYEGVKFEIMHSLHNSLLVMQEPGSPAKSESTSSNAPRQLRETWEPPPGTPLGIVHEYQPPGLAPE